MRRIPALTISKIKDEILGKRYELSVAFVSLQKSRELNRIYRKKNKPANVLSFPLDKNSGEIVLCDEARGEFSLGFLLIHGMLHLKGMPHSSKMEQLESHYDQKYFHRHRRRLLKSESSSGRVSKRRKKS